MLLAKTLRSTTFRLALINIVIFGAIVVGLLGYVYRSTSAYVLSRTDGAIAADIAALQTSFAGAGRGALIDAIAKRLADPHAEGIYYLLVDRSFAPLAGNVANWPAALKGDRGWGHFRTGEGQPLLRAKFDTLADGGHLLVGLDTGDLGGIVRTIDVALGVALALILALAVVASVMVTRRTVGRIESINATSRAIMQSGLGRRIELRGTHDEWDELAANLNSMLDRIEALMEQVKQVTDNIAHDLRTPLSRIRGRLERAYGKPRIGDEDQSLIADSLGDLDGVLGMFASLMRISQIEASDRNSALHLVDLAPIASEVAELFDAAAEEAGVRLVTATDARVDVLGDRDLLFDALANLVDNAIKHGRQGGRVKLEVRNSDDGALVTVTDDGPGIPAEKRGRVFDRLYRLERSRAAPGNGLGLSLVAAVAHLHAARIEMADNRPGLKLQLRFPPLPRDEQDVSPTTRNSLQTSGASGHSASARARAKPIARPH